MLAGSGVGIGLPKKEVMLTLDLVKWRSAKKKSKESNRSKGSGAKRGLEFSAGWGLAKVGKSWQKLARTGRPGFGTEELQVKRNPPRRLRAPKSWIFSDSSFSFIHEIHEIHS